MKRFSPVVIFLDWCSPISLFAPGLFALSLLGSYRTESPCHKPLVRPFFVSRLAQPTWKISPGDVGSGRGMGFVSPIGGSPLGYWSSKGRPLGDRERFGDARAPAYLRVRLDQDLISRGEIPQGRGNSPGNPARRTLICEMSVERMAVPLGPPALWF